MVRASPKNSERLTRKQLVDRDLDKAGWKIVPEREFDPTKHRGYTASETAIWRRTMDHFDAIKIGLTATPAAHTTSYFKDVVYR